MRKTLTVLFALAVLAAATLATERAKALYKTHRLSIGDVAISCDDGRAPTIQNLNEQRIVIVSCPLGRNQD